jgi:hypothetical protein
VRVKGLRRFARNLHHRSARNPEARGDAGDAERAHALLTQARSIAERIGQSAVLADVVGLIEQRAEM